MPDDLITQILSCTTGKILSPREVHIQLEETLLYATFQLSTSVTLAGRTVWTQETLNPPIASRQS